MSEKNNKKKREELKKYTLEQLEQMLKIKLSKFSIDDEIELIRDEIKRRL